MSPCVGSVPAVVGLGWTPMLHCSMMRAPQGPGQEPRHVPYFKRRFLMQYFKHELFACHAFTKTLSERSYRRSLRYGHARHGGLREQHEPAPAPATLITLPRVQAVVDAMLAASSSSPTDRRPSSRAA
jgi:hypothetical protein